MSLVDEVKAKEEVWDSRDDVSQLMDEATKALASRTRSLAVAALKDPDAQREQQQEGEEGEADEQEAVLHRAIDLGIKIDRLDQPDVVQIEPNHTVVHIGAGRVDLPKEDLPGVVDDGSSSDLEPGLGTRGRLDDHGEPAQVPLGGEHLHHRTPAQPLDRERRADDDHQHVACEAGRRRATPSTGDERDPEQDRLHDRADERVDRPRRDRDRRVRQRVPARRPRRARGSPRGVKR